MTAVCQTVRWSQLFNPVLFTAQFASHVLRKRIPIVWTIILDTGIFCLRRRKFNRNTITDIDSAAVWTLPAKALFYGYSLQFTSTPIDKS